jgi:hypothetical protein
MARYKTDRHDITEILLKVALSTINQTKLMHHEENGKKDKQHNGRNKMEIRTNNTRAARKWKQGQTTQWPQENGKKDKQHNGRKKMETRTNNTMAARKWKKGQTMVDKAIHIILTCRYS